MSIIHRSAADELRRGFVGTVLLPADDGYDEARTLFNALIDRRPAVIAQCDDADDVARAIGFAREHDLEIAVRGGGHGVAGKAMCDGGMVVDLRRMHAVTVDVDACVAVVAGGATTGHLDRATEPHGLATTGGRVSTTGVGGFTLGGGSGWLERKMGLACDNLLAVELVTAQGEIMRASEVENSDLFWALHGGGGNFGVATAFTFRLHPLPRVTAALLLWRPEAGEEVVRAYRDFFGSAPDEVGGGLIYITAPEEPFVPSHLTGRLACAVLVTYAGPESEAREVIQPLLELGHEGEMVAEMSYADLQCMLDDPPGYRNYWSAEYLADLPDEAIASFCGAASKMIVPSPSQHVLLPQGGAVGRLGRGYPIPWREAPWVVHPFGVWAEPRDDERGRSWARSVRREMSRWSMGAVYLNFIGDEGVDRVVAAFGEANYRRLAEIKSTWDPDNVFHLNHNIPPARGGATPFPEPPNDTEPGVQGAGRTLRSERRQS